MSQTLKIPPQAPEVEEAILGAILLEHDALLEAMQVIPSEEVFYSPANQKIYACITSMYHKGKAIDLLTVMEELRTGNQLSDVGGPYYLSKITGDVVSSAHTATHARIVVEKYLLRRLISMCGETIKRAFEQDDPFDIFDDFMHAFNNINDAKNNTTWINSQQAATLFLKERQDMLDNNGQVGISTTFSALDDRNAGFRPGNLVLLAARPSVGKSAVATGIAVETARKGLPVGILNLEMSIEETFGRMVALDSGIHHSTIERDTQLDQHTLLSHVTDVAQLPIYFSTNIRMNIRSIISAAEYLKRKCDIQLLIIDYLQLVEGDDNNRGNREQEVSKISRGLKILARALRIPIIALSQLNRKSDERGDKRPSMSDLRESGALEQDADIIMLLHRDWRSGIFYDKDGRSTEHDADLLVPKWRNGTPCDVKLHFQPQIMKFSQAWE